MSETNQTYHYNKMAEAITYLDENFREQPSLDAIAEHIHLSPFHFQRLFKEWVGISPKKYLQFISANYAKGLLRSKETNLFDTAFQTGLSGTGRLHDLFIRLEGMTPGEYKNGGENLSINYSFTESPFGNVIVASTEKGICHLDFVEESESALMDLQSQFPNATYRQQSDKIQQSTLCIFQNDWSNLNEIKLHLKGTAFQLKVWQALLSIPYGSLTTYGDLSKKIDCPKAPRAVGTAIGSNPVAYLIPCHRVIQQSGNIGGYRWNPIRKKIMIWWEAAELELSDNPFQHAL
ncbi:MAG: methylated-DNA--[protein]-cysteine S-methyltransferase [Bacteroidales bacterium]|nr:methylated-DNA--[protein]-cysteine S-methyltransferase [Bacteroidales bacterium]